MGDGKKENRDFTHSNSESNLFSGLSEIEPATSDYRTRTSLPKARRTHQESKYSEIDEQEISALYNEMKDRYLSVESAQGIREITIGPSPVASPNRQMSQSSHSTAPSCKSKSRAKLIRTPQNQLESMGW